VGAGVAAAEAAHVRCVWGGGRLRRVAAAGTVFVACGGCGAVEAAF
jgi:hypothetical protein